VDKNTTAHGRAENRRVDVRLMTNNVEAPNPGQAQSPASAASANAPR
jgi:hypothetical protein